MPKSTYDRVQEILMDARLQTGRMAQADFSKMTPEEIEAMQRLNNSNFDDVRKAAADFDKWLRS